MDGIVSESQPQIIALGMLSGVNAVAQGNSVRARGMFLEAASQYAALGDELDRATCLLWVVLVEHRARRNFAARRAATEAAALIADGDFRAAPNWWAAELRETALLHVDGPFRETVARLVPGRRWQQSDETRTVEISRDAVLVGGRPLDAGCWSQGRTGRHVLRRLLTLIADAFPSAAHRDALCDELWPDSDGDRAVHNLYAAMNDLRQVLAAAPGAEIVAVDGGYALRIGDNVRVIGSQRPPRTR